jgi:hypothetical protein
MPEVRQKIDYTDSPSNDMDTILHDFLGWLKNRFEKSVSHAEDSQSLLGIGVKDQFAQEWEGFLKNPIELMYATKQSIDNTLHNFINTMVSAYLKKKLDIVAKAFWADAKGNALYYCITLTEDTLENRIDLNEFFEFYDEHRMSDNYPVYFHFIPEKYIPNIKYRKQIV